MRLTRFAVGGLLLLTLGQRPAEPADSAKPEDVIRKMSDFYKQQKSFSVTSETQVKVRAKGLNNTSKSSFTAVFERPNHFALRGKGGTRSAGLTVVSDGDTLYMHIAALKKYSKEDAPQSLAQLAESPLTNLGTPRGVRNFIFDFLTDDPAKLILKGVTASKDLGTAKVDGQPARHLQFTGGKLDWEVWVADDKDPILLRVEYDLSKTVRGPKDLKVTLDQTFKDWKFGLTPSPKDFSFTPPKNAREVHSLFERDDSPSPLLGKAAPAVDLERLDGNRVKLANDTGKNVVMLDMWATWCGPCRQELPHLIEVAKDYRAKGVVLYAIDIDKRESKMKIEEFLKKEKLDMTVGLDSKGNVAEAYGVEGIPMLMLIDKHGVVQCVHIGYEPGIDKVLHKELDGILAGKNLAAATISEYEAKKKAANKAKTKQQKDKEKKPSNEQTAR
jgi:peroxiredoxin